MVIYREENVLFLSRLLDRQIKMIIPRLAPFIRQAVSEGDFHTEYP